MNDELIILRIESQLAIIDKAMFEIKQLMLQQKEQKMKEQKMKEFKENISKEISSFPKDRTSNNDKRW